MTTNYFLMLPQVAVVLLDTQGTFDKESTLKQNTSIVALNALISSIQIVNIHERFESQDLTNLEVLSHLTSYTVGPIYLYL